MSISFPGAPLPPGPTRWGVAIVVAALALGGCYDGLSGLDGDGAAGNSDAGPSSGDGAEEIPENYVPDPAQIRLLSALEYRNTMRDLLGVEVSAELAYGEVGSGYDNDAAGQLGETLFTILYTEAQDAAQQYVGGQLGAEFPCFDPGAPLADACATSIVEGLGARAFRRPVDEAAREQLLTFAAGINTGGEQASRVAELLVTRILMSPRFLYRTEIGTALPDRPELASLDPYERASLVSYTLTGSMPDEALMADAAADRLDLATIRGHVRRLIDTEAGRRHMARFFKQWLRVGALDEMAAAPEDFSKFANPEQAMSLQAEFAAFVDAVVIDDKGTLADVLTRAVAHVDRHTAPLYGAQSMSNELEAVDLDPTERGGMLTLASVMAVHSSSAETHRDKPIRRGLLVKNQLLCEHVGLPSGIDVQEAAAGVSEDVPDFDGLTTREQLELIMNQDTLCIACHQTFMPYGFLWGNFDALGQYQTQFGDRPIDPAVDELNLDGEIAGYGDIMEMLPALASSPQVAECFSTNVARFAVGHAENNLIDHLGAELGPELGPGDGGLPITVVFEEALGSAEMYAREAQ